jgi:hypothetical protein
MLGLREVALAYALAVVGTFLYLGRRHRVLCCFQPAWLLRGRSATTES